MSSNARKPLEFSGHNEWGHPSPFIGGHPSPFIGGTYRAVCTHVTDGDTLDIMMDIGFGIYLYQNVRLAGINTPELTSRDPVVKAQAEAARDAVRQKALSQPVVVKTLKDNDKYGRYLADVLLWDSVAYTWYSLNQWLVVQGLAVVMS